MSTIKLRNTISEYLMRIEDISFLNALKTIIETKVKASEEVYLLSEFQKQRIEKGREQTKLGKTITHEALQKEIDQWLNTK